MAFFVIGIILIVGGGMFYLAAQREKGRRLEMQALATRLGWAYAPQPPLSILSDPGRLALFTTGRRQAIRNHVSGERDGRRMATFDYTYVTGYGKSRRVRGQTVVHVQLSGRTLSAFVLEPEGVIDKLAELLGVPDIDVAADPEFSRRYLLRGTDEAAVRALFHADVRDFFLRPDGWHAEAAGADLFLWRTRRSVHVEADAMLHHAAELADRLARHAASASAPAA